MPLTQLGDGSDAILTWHIQTTRDQVWDCLTNAEALGQWLGELVEGAVRLGQDFVVDHGDGYLCSSSVVACIEGEQLGYTWQFPDEPPSRVTFVLEEEPDGSTVVRLSHSGLGDLTESYRLGWCVHFTYLEAASRGAPLPLSLFWPLHATMEKLRSR